MVMLAVYELLVGLAAATAQESDAEIRCMIQIAQAMTVISRYTYPVVYFFQCSESMQHRLPCLLRSVTVA